uniref:Uncharacterized protein n=1 Tax=Glossina pallidipes TaxID=7398 RepID=A0A1A9ZUV8_GLOPL
MALCREATNSINQAIDLISKDVSVSDSLKVTDNSEAICKLGGAPSLADAAMARTSPSRFPFSVSSCHAKDSPVLRYFRWTMLGSTSHSSSFVQLKDRFHPTVYICDMEFYARKKSDTRRQEYRFILSHYILR